MTRPSQGTASFPGPHRFPFLLVDRLASGEGGDVVLRVRSVADRLPGAPAAGEALPASLLVEVMAQGALWLLAARGSDDGEGVDAVRLAGIDGARFHRPVADGDRLSVSTEILGRFGDLSKVSCRVERNGETVAEAGLLLVR